MLTFTISNSMKNIVGLLIVFILCGCNHAPKYKKTAVTTPVDLSNKGIGPVSNVQFDLKIDSNLAEKGDKIFGVKCTSCHMVTTRSIGPAMKGIYDRRSPEWVMNIMLNPTEMLKKDPIAMALLKEYNNVIMLNQNLTVEEARAIAEYLRTL